MRVIIADNAGFCYGVKRAVNKTNKVLETSKEKTYSYGPLIHNPQMIEYLESQGLTSIESLSEVDNGNLIIRAHGIPKDTSKNISDSNLNEIDCTCPYVKAIQSKVEKFYSEGYSIVIIGDPLHPEIIGINGYSNNSSYIVNNIEESLKLPEFEKVCVVSQTTYTESKFNEIVKIVESKSKIIEVFNTICNATKIRQESAANVARKVDAMIVIGGYNSSNTNKLAEISRGYCNNVFHIEKIDDLNLQELLKFNTIGITAGASTPDWIIKEAVQVMENLNNNEENKDLKSEEVEETNEEIVEEQEEVVEETVVEKQDKEVSEEDEMNREMMDAIDSSFKRIRRGEVLKGEVLFVTNNEVMVNINYKSDGIINRDELSSDPEVNPKDIFKQGDEINVYVISTDDGEGNVVLSSKRVEDMLKWEELEEMFNNEEVVEAKVINVVKGGLIAVVNGINGFIPASHASAKYISDLDQLKGKVFNVDIIDFDMEKRRIILSRKEVEQKELEEMKKEVWSNLEINKVVEGVVQRLTDFGAFVDLGGVDGLIHISDLSWNRVRHPSEVVKAGETVEVRVLNLDEERNRISLGLKQTVEEPWVSFKENTEVGDKVIGKIVNILDFGAFVRIKDGVDGLLHVSQISHEHVNKPSDVLSIGDEVTVKIIDIDFDERRISLSMKELDEKVVEEKKEKEVKKEAEKEAIESDDGEVTIGDILNSK